MQNYPITFTKVEMNSIWNILLSLKRRMAQPFDLLRLVLSENRFRHATKMLGHPFILHLRLLTKHERRNNSIHLKLELK